MYLVDLIEFLKREIDEGNNVVCRLGFGHPHSWRGDYSELAFEPERNVTVGQMLNAAESALNNTYQGYKGGDFTMTAYTECWLAYEGEYDGSETIGVKLLSFMVSKDPWPHGELRPVG